MNTVASTRAAARQEPPICSLAGVVAAGRGIAACHVKANKSELKTRIGCDVVDGTLNVVLQRPVKFERKSAITVTVGNETRYLWRGSLQGTPVWLYRWLRTPLHIVELLSPVHLRDAFGLQDGDDICIEICADDIAPLPLSARLAWAVVWAGRSTWFYKSEQYYVRTSRLCNAFGAAQGKDALLPRIVRQARRRIKRTPYIGPLAAHLKTAADKRLKSGPSPYVFQRIAISDSDDSQALARKKVRNLLNYTKLSGSSYAAFHYPAGYHSIDLNGHFIRGQRDPARRLAATNVDFRGKTILDIGCNQGGMLLPLAGSLRWGVGLDYDPRMINAANKISSVLQADRLHFYVFDLEKEPLALISDFLPDSKVDIVFLLSVCMWIKNWEQVILFAAHVSESMLFETNGDPDQQVAQRRCLAKLYGSVTTLSEASEDDPEQKSRMLLLCRDVISSG
ncbi:MAG TPA: DUF120 domain-containing protein [Burkholderiales bacterium]|nr:DUF120 domain-containing protein [Burkholderiales bacterium]